MNNEALELEIAVLQEISFAIAREKNVQRLLNQIMDVLCKRMNMRKGTITLKRDQKLVIQASHGLDEIERARGQYLIGEGITGEVGKTGKAQLVPDIRKSKKFLNKTQSRNATTVTAFLCVPIVYREEVIGTLSVDRQVEKETHLDEDMRFLDIVSNIIAEAVAACMREEEEREFLLEENSKLRELLNDTSTSFVGKSRPMLNVYKLINQVAPSDATVFIRGGSGTGKELVARAIVNQSPRKDKPFIIINCAALPENLLESELFGHEKGAFTGAFARRIGRAEEADGGTLFLDEIGDLSLHMQVKLLRLLQQRTFSRIGSNRELKTDVRFIAATSLNIEDLIEKKLFREDLYYRLNIFPILLPDLKKRGADITLLAENFIEKFNTLYGKAVKRISPTALKLLMNYDWPGNVRELENCIERAILLAKDDCIHSYDLPPSLQNEEWLTHETAPPKGLLDERLARYEKQIIIESLKEHNGNKAATARALGISARTMHYKLAQLGITRQESHSS